MSAAGTEQDFRGGERLARALGHLLVLVLIFAALQGLFFAANVAAAALPKDAILHNIEASADSPLAAYYDNSREVLGSSVSYGNNRFIGALAEQDDYGGDVVRASVVNSITYTIEGVEPFEYDYYRYWHGWQLPLFLLLMVGGFDFVAVVLGILTLLIVVFFCLQLRHYVGWCAAIAFAFVAFFSTNIFGNFAGDLTMQLSALCVGLFGGVALLVGRRTGARRGAFAQTCICLACACCFCFLDFFTISVWAMALAVFCAMIASGCLEREFKRAVALFAKYCIVFAVGFALTWACKWLIAAAFLGLPVVMANVLFEAGAWTGAAQDQGGSSLATRAPRLYAVAISAWRVVNSGFAERALVWNVAGIAGVALAVLGCVLMVVAAVRSRKARRVASAGDGAALAPSKRIASLAGGTWGLLLPCALIVIAPVVMSSHVIFHASYYGYRPWVFLLADLACVGIYALLHTRPRGLHSA